jgi:thiamine biosynthesis lipoprotein
VAGYWLSLGGDILCNGSDAGGNLWKIGIAKADHPDEAAAYITSDGDRYAIATSGITKRKGADWHHIIDPRSGRPATTDILTATVTGESATAADVYAKCLVILGARQAVKFIKDHSLASALLQIRHNNSVEIKRYGALT